MILADLKKFLQQHKVVNIMDLAIHFDTDLDTLRGMLDVWIQKGKVRKIPNQAQTCNKCAQCHMQSVEFYEWLD